KRRKEYQQARIRAKYGNPESIEKLESVPLKLAPTAEESTELNYIQQSELVSDADINAIPSSPPVLIQPERREVIEDPRAFVDEEQSYAKLSQYFNDDLLDTPSSPSTHSNATLDIEAATQAILDRPRSPTPNSDTNWDIEAILQDALSDDEGDEPVIPETETPLRYRYAGDGDSILLTSSPTLRRSRRRLYTIDEDSILHYAQEEDFNQHDSRGDFNQHDSQDDSFSSHDAQEDSGLHRSLTPPRRHRYRYVILDERDKIAPSPTLRRASQPSPHATKNTSKDENHREDSDEDSDEDYREDSDDQDEAEFTEEEEAESTPIQPPTRRQHMTTNSDNDEIVQPEIPAIVPPPHLLQDMNVRTTCTMVDVEECLKHSFRSGQAAARSKDIMMEKYRVMANAHRLGNDRLKDKPCFFGSAFFGKYAAPQYTLMEFLNHWLPLNGVQYNGRTCNGSICWTRIHSCKIHICSTRCLPLHVIAAFSTMDIAQSIEYSNGSSQSSHLCHHRACISTDHVIIESSSKNSSRARCSTAAKKMRKRGVKIPQKCDVHSPPCLLREATLTREEMAVAGYAMACGFTGRSFEDEVMSRNCLGTINETFKPHPYTYFHYPGPFPEDFGVKAEKGHEVTPFWHPTRVEEQIRPTGTGGGTREKRPRGRPKGSKDKKKRTLNKNGKRPLGNNSD
ncbi:hypothetical protein V496_02770, partial [Pseudogymnoascus sp. VKM F-4515 (FW-2607)]